MSNNYIRIVKKNGLTRGEFKCLMEDPQIHLKFLRQRLYIESNGAINDILEELEMHTTDVYFADVISNNTTCYIYFYSDKDFAQFRRLS